MPALLDTLDRFNHTSSSIRSLTQSQLLSADPRPFTSAILQLSPQDLLRDADEVEYGLFTLVRDSSDTPPEKNGDQCRVGRRMFMGATPLRGKRAGVGMKKNEEPEVYVEAALKYLDRFDAVKSMPEARARLDTIINRLNNVRDSIERLQTSLEENAKEELVSPKSQIVEEERRIGELKSRILQLRKRREALISQLPAKSKTQLRGAERKLPPKAGTSTAPSRRSFDSQSSIASPPTSQTVFEPKSKLIRTGESHSRTSRPPAGKSIPRKQPINRTAHKEPVEDEGLSWSGGGPSNLVLTDPSVSSSLLDESLDLSGADVLMSPTPPAPGPKRSSAPFDDSAEGHSKGSIPDPADDLSEDQIEDSDSGEPTVVISRLAPLPPPATAPPSPPPSRTPSRSPRHEIRTPIQDNKTTIKPPSTKKEKRVRITAEVERICANIWSAIPDLLVPGNDFSVPGKKPPNARDTITVLRTISAQPIPGPSSDSVSSPSTRSTLSSLLGIDTLTGGSPHQIMTAQVLLSLLTAPKHVLPLTTLKALLASKAAVPSPGPDAGREAKQNAAVFGASAAQAGTRALYGCVAKKLVKIDRGGGEQIVKFD